jgi:hypothetical protein
MLRRERNDRPTPQADERRERSRPGMPRRHCGVGQGNVPSRPQPSPIRDQRSWRMTFVAGIARNIWRVQRAMPEVARREGLQ